MPTIAHLCEECQQERDRFSNEQVQESPACLELFHRSLAQVPQAYDCFYRIFAKQVTSYTFRQVQASYCSLSLELVSDIVADAFMSFLRYSINRNQAADQPTDALKNQEPIEETTNFARVIGYIQATIRNRVAEICRQKVNTAKFNKYKTISAEELLASGKDIPSPDNSDDPIDRLTILRFVEKHIEDEDSRKEQQHRIVAEWGLMQDIPPREIHKEHPQFFASPEEVNKAKQRLQRRLLSDPEFVRLYSPRRNSGSGTSLQFKFDGDEIVMPNNQDSFAPCPLSEEVLLDYINEAASAEVITAVEQSPSCLRAVDHLRDQLSFLQPLLRQVFCPDSNTLIAYQEKKLTDSATDNDIALHVAHCSACQQELKLLAAIDAKSRLDPSAVMSTSAPKPGVAEILRRVYELIFQPATLSPVPLLGQGSYRTVERMPQIELLAHTSRTAGKQRNWLLSGRLRYAGDQPVTQVESVVLQDMEDEDTPERSTTVDETGAFTFRGLDAGIYRLRIISVEEEIILNRFVVGDEA